MDFEIIGEIRDQETFATGSGIRELTRLRRVHGHGNWRKRKGKAKIRVNSGEEFDAEIHWYEAHGIGKKELKIKNIL